MLFSTSGRSGSSAAGVQILEDIDRTLDAALDICSSNKDLLTDAERTKFFNTHTRLSGARVQLTESTKCSKLSKILGECESLKMKINRTCLKHRDKEIRKILERSLASASSAPLVVASKPPQNSPPVTAPTSPSQTQQSVGGSSQTSPAQTHRSQDGSSSIIIQQNFSNVSLMHQPEIPMSQLAEDTSRALSNTLAALAMKLHARNIESECMIFNGNSVAKSPTMNIDSPNAVGATKVYDGTRPVQNSPPSIAIAENQGPPRVSTWRERCMTFEGGVVDDPTFNIRSPGASGAW